MIKKIYAVKETCQLFSKDYEVIKYPLLTNKKEAEKFKYDLETIDAERFTCCEYEIIEFNLSDSYEEDKYKFHSRWGDVGILNENDCEDFEQVKED